MVGSTTVNLTQYLTSLGEVFEFFLSKFSDILGLFISSPYLMIVSGIMITGAVVGLVGRLSNR